MLEYVWEVAKGMFMSTVPCRSESGALTEDYPLAPGPIAKADFIPLRLSHDERKTQRLMRSILLASRYTDKVDRESLLANNQRNAVIAREIANALTGFVIGDDMKAGAVLLKNKEFEPFEETICAAIEACRRYKIMNPDLLRTDYVKFLYMIQDAVQNDNVREMLGFSVVSPLITVGRFCDAIGCPELLDDPQLPLCITPVPMMQDRRKLNRCLRFKDVSVTELVKKHSKRPGSSAAGVELAIRSLNDANHFANDNVDSVDRMLGLLKAHFHPIEFDAATDLSINEGEGGSRLSHTHALQYKFVLQSLSLWKNICREMFSLWVIAEEDVLNPDEKYCFRFTGQGYQRVQKAPKLYRAVQEILQKTKEELGAWVGSEGIHLGDDQVPNAFHFIDKYGQVSRIIIPILRTVDHVSKMTANPDHNRYIKGVWGSAENAQRVILQDFFRYGFDGSGGDNMADAGSCIDGRLTSAWNWCNTIRKKPFFPLFLFAGFNSFDGDLSL